MSRVWAKDYQVNTEYAVDDQVYYLERFLLKCHTAHNSGASFSWAFWSLVNNQAYDEIRNLNTTNCNSSTAWTQMAWWTIQWPVENSDFWTPSANWITANRDIKVLALANMYRESTENRVNVWIEFTVNWVRQNIMWASWYIRGSNDHEESSSHISQILELSAWDIVGIIMFRMAGAGVVAAPVGKSNLILNLLSDD